MPSGLIPYRLEDVYSSFYKIDSITKINYEQYIPKNQDERWSIQMELNIRKQNPQCLIALLSKELWCFSINDDPLPTLPKMENNKTSIIQSGDTPDDMTDDSVLKPEKSGNFTADYSKPNLPPYYALFLKALRKCIYINLTLNSNNSLIQFGNACISLNPEQNSKNLLFQAEPHLFSNSDLVLSISVKDMELFPLKEENINQEFSGTHALYIAPSGIRAFLKCSNQQKNIVSPPKNAAVLLSTLNFSHGIDLTKKEDLQWVTLIPHLGHLSGQTPSISSYMDVPSESREITWPLDLCFAQASFDNDLAQKEDSYAFESFQNTLDMIDDFIQVKQTSAYRTPGASGAPGTNPMSTGGPFTEQFQLSNKKSAPSAHGPIGISPLGGIQSSIRHPGGADSNNNTISSSNQRLLNSNQSNVSPLYANTERLTANAPDLFGPEFSTTPNSNENSNELFNDRKPDLRISPAKSDMEKSLMLMDSVLDDDSLNNKELFGDDEEDLMDLTGKGDSASITGQQAPGDGDTDNNEEDLFGETPGDDAKMSGSKLNSDEITEEMFGMSDDDDSGENSAGKIGSSKSKTEEGNIEQSDQYETPRKHNLKRRYLDIPIDEMTLSNSPLYTDPGAPLPVETPRERRRSVFEPLTFNPIIENNVDNKYKKGGKFSLSPVQREEALKFDVSTGELSSSDEEDSDSSLEGFDYPTIKQDLRSLDGHLNEGTFLSGQTGPDSIPPGLLSGNFSSNGDPFSVREGSNAIWRIPASDVPATDSPMKSIETSIPSPIDGNNPPDAYGKSLRDETYKILDNNTTIKGEMNNKNSSKGNDVIMIDHSSGSESPGNSLSRPASNIPFLLRHMPLSSIPDVFLTNNPVISLNSSDQSILCQICEQIVFDNGVLSNLQIPTRDSEGANVHDSGLVVDTIKSLFPQLDQLSGSTLINKIYPMKKSFVFIKKQEELIKIRADVQKFGKFLNFKPPFGIKNFKFLLLTNTLQNDCLAFASTLSQTYIGQEFGFSELLKLSDEEMNGLIYMKEYDKTRLLLLSAQIVSHCSTNKNSGNDANIMVILPLEKGNLADLVLKTKIFQLIREEVRSKLPELELFFKVVPMEMVKNPLVSVDAYYNLCTSIYNILPSKKMKYTTIAHKLPDKITFRTMKSTHESSVIHYDVYIHLAYARSADKQWVFAALSDSDGKENTIKSWYVGDSKTAFDKACNDIWTLGLSLANTQYGKICLILTRLDGILPDDELMNWRRLSGRNVHLAVVCVDDSNKIAFMDQDRIYPSFKPIFTNESLAMQFNPKNIDNYEIRNIDEDIHGVIFEHPFPLANSQHRCAIKSGALVRFKKNSGNSTWDKFEVNLLNCPHSDSTQLLQTILEEFRNLAALNTWFGITDGQKSHIPWHVLAVKKMMTTIVHIQVDNANNN